MEQPSTIRSRTVASHDGDDFLDSWKEISLFLKRGIRTVQRWESTEGLPVHRHRHLKRGTVFAFASEIRSWLSSRDGNAPANGDTSFENHEAITGAGQS